MTGRYKVTGQFYTLQFLTVLLLRRKTGKSKKARNIREKQTVREPILIFLFKIGSRTIMAEGAGFACISFPLRGTGKEIIVFASVCTGSCTCPMACADMIRILPLISPKTEQPGLWPGCSVFGGGCRIRTRVDFRPNGFQDRPVMTASVTLHVCEPPRGRSALI